MKRLLSILVIVAAVGCGVKLPPIAITFSPPTNTTPKPEPTPIPEPPTPVEPAPPAVELPPLVNLNLVVHDAAGLGIPKAQCATKDETRTADGSGFINFAVRGSMVVTCMADGYHGRSVDLPPGDHRFPLMADKAAPPPPFPPQGPVLPPASSPLCAERDRDPLTCVRQAAAKYSHLLQTNTFASTTEFTQRVLELLGPDWGHVGKPAGGAQHVPNGFTPVDARGADGNIYHITGVSHDAIKHRLTGQVVDILGNATANEPCDPTKVAECWKPGFAVPQWGLVQPKDWRAENPFIPAVPLR